MCCVGVRVSLGVCCNVELPGLNPGRPPASPRQPSGAFFAVPADEASLDTPQQHYSLGSHIERSSRETERRPISEYNSSTQKAPSHQSRNACSNAPHDLCSSSHCPLWPRDCYYTVPQHKPMSCNLKDVFALIGWNN